MEQTKYEQKVRERAEEIALITNPKSKGYTLERIAKRCEPIARLSLQQEAEAYRKGFIHVSGGGFAEVSVCEQQLQSLGLVP
jgi:hypothetical protein